ncbi:MAG TPA: pyridoxal-dependent decarboxylase [Haliangiales bacterium]|nr:pyridoxal-dependent decarboxylase [Haliangiales bacterium]
MPKDHVDWRALLERTLGLSMDFLRSLPDRPVSPRRDPAALLAAFDAPVPDGPSDPLAVIEHLAAAADPGLTAMPSGRFFGWVIGAALPAAVAADWLTSVWDQNAGSAEGTPAAAVVEQVALRWIVELLDLPRGCSGALVTGAQMANFVGIAAARDRVLAAAGWDVADDGLIGAPPVRVLVGAERHNTVDRAMRFLGLGGRRVVVVDADADGRMRADALRRALAAGGGPTIVCAQVGNVNGGGIDPMPAIADAVDAARARLAPGEVWLHVDGAFGLWARASAAHRAGAAGVERADSWATDAHKWLNTPYDCGIALTAHPEAHRRALGTRAHYLPGPDDSVVRTPYDYSPELSRRARGFAVYAALRQLGRAGVADLIDRTCALALRFADELGRVPGVEVIGGPGLNQLVVRFRDPDGRDDDRHTRDVVRRVTDEGVCYPSPTVWKGVAGMRISVSSYRTDEADVRRSVDAIARAHREA